MISRMSYSSRLSWIYWHLVTAWIQWKLLLFGTHSFFSCRFFRAVAYRWTTSLALRNPSFWNLQGKGKRKREMTFGLSYRPGGGVGMWLMQGCAAWQGMVFGLNRMGIFELFPVLNRVRVQTLSGSPVPKRGSSAPPGLWGGLLNQRFEKSGFHCNLTDGSPIGGDPARNLKSIPTTLLAIWNYLSDDFLNCTALSPITITYYILPLVYIQLCCSFVQINYYTLHLCFSWHSVP